MTGTGQCPEAALSWTLVAKSNTHQLLPEISAQPGAQETQLKTGIPHPGSDSKSWLETMLLCREFSREQGPAPAPGGGVF